MSPRQRASTKQRMKMKSSRSLQDLSRAGVVHEKAKYGDLMIENTVSLNEDIFNAILLLKVYQLWDHMSTRDQNAMRTVAVLCAVVQLMTMGTLWGDTMYNRSWRQEELEVLQGGIETSTFISKTLCIIMLSVYFAKDMVTLMGLQLVRLNVSEFGRRGVPGVHCLMNWIFTYHIVSVVLAITLSLIIISTSNSSLDAILNSVAITFILDIDEWLYGFVKDHAFLHGGLFEITLKQNELSTHRFSEQWYFVHKGCCGGATMDAPDAAKGSSLSRRVSLWSYFTWFSVSIMCLIVGFAYRDVPDWHPKRLQLAGFILLGGIAVVITVFGVWYVVVGCLYESDNRKRFREYEASLEDLANQYRAKLTKDEKHNEAVENNFIDECFEILYREHIGVDDDFEYERKLRAKLMDAPMQP
mmetsp:Transcript_58905/g.97447  ORF Transcript_58905/g.97447 Transcript_58905/m.97447 type:complete len:414 (-) Transcript_58905:63-1304(-)